MISGPCPCRSVHRPVPADFQCFSCPDRLLPPALQRLCHWGRSIRARPAPSGVRSSSRRHPGRLILKIFSAGFELVWYLLFASFYIFWDEYNKPPRETENLLKIFIRPVIPESVPCDLLFLPFR